MTDRPNLSKSKYLTGRQCLRRLWLVCLGKGAASPPDAALQARLDAGTEVGEKARLLFPGGVLVKEAAFHHAKAIEHTRRLLNDPSVPALFEAAFEYDRIRIRVDVLERLAGGSWGLREVKAGTRVAKVHLDDVAIQCYVLKGCAVRLQSAEVIHIDNTYVRSKGKIDWPRLFSRGDVTDQVEARLGRIPDMVKEFHRMLALSQAPVVEPSLHCFTPYDCEFWDHCTHDKPQDWILGLPGLRERQLRELTKAGIERISKIPDDFRLSAVQARVLKAWRLGREFVSPDLARAVSGFGPPAEYLDFESMNPAIPLYPGTRPYQQIPFQWSLHRVDAEGSVSHRQFLADGHGDPRRGFAETLVEALGETDNPIIVYASFESTVLKELAALFPDLGERLEKCKARLRDLCRLVSRHIYNPAFHGSFSIKDVAPALSPGFGYDGIGAITNGSLASTEFARIAQGKLKAEEEARVRRDLLAYCRNDTQALLEVHWALLRRAEN